MWWKRRPKFQWAYVVGYGSNYHSGPHLSLDIFGHKTMRVWVWCRVIRKVTIPSENTMQIYTDFHSHTISFSHVCHLNWGGGLCLPANLELISQEKCYKEVMDSSINQLVTRHLLTHPRKQRGTWCFHYFGSLHVPYLFAVAHFNLLHWLLFACLGWQRYRA